jgi:hypothetical protein
MSHKDLSDIGKIEQAIKFVALNQPLPIALVEWLTAENLLDKIANPGILENTLHESNGNSTVSNN